MDAYGCSNEDWTGKKSGDVASWPIKIVQSQPSNLANQVARVFHVKFPIKRCSSPCKHNFRLNREDIKRFWSKFISSL